MLFKTTVHAMTRFVAVCAMLSTIVFVGGLATSVTPAQAAVVSNITVQGGQRIDDQSVRGFLTIEPGRSFSTIDIDDSLKALFATGLFSDVQIFQRGSTLVVRVEENPTISNVIIRGNRKLKTKELKASIQSNEVGILSDNVLESDRERIEEQYRRIGREDVQVNVRTVPLSNNRVNVVFEIEEGGRTRIKKILFVGNNAFGDRRLRNVINTKQSGLLSFISRDDTYDPDRLAADEETLARYYYDRGYADFEVVSAVADLDESNNEYTITITVNEGDKYEFGDVQIDSTIQGIDEAELQRAIRSRTGRVYSAKRVEETIEELNRSVASEGFAFGQITPRGERNFEDRTIDVVYIVDEGPRAYIERINIIGNDRTRDYVIRREFDIAEGDAYNQVLVDAARRRLEALGFFDFVRITTSQGSASDRVVLNVAVKDKSTGSFTIGAGYSTNDGIVGNVALSERNFLGRGQFIKISAGLGTKVKNYELAFTEPYFLGRRISAGFNVYNQTREDTSSRPFDTESKGGSVTFGAPLTRRLNVSATYALDITDVNNSTLAAGATGLLEPNGRTLTSSLGYTLQYNSLDSLSSPRNGVLASFSQTFAGLGGDVTYLRTEAKVAAYKALLDDSDLVAFANLRGGHITGLGKRLRYQDHFSPTTQIIRGFTPNEFGPFSQAAQLHTGTTAYAAISAEMQFPMPILGESLGVRGALFADAAYLGSASGVLPSGAASNLVGVNQIRTSAGVSIIWDSPLGPLRGDFAKALTKSATDKTQLFNFGISRNF